MTAEISIMNKMGIALAADSAVTVVEKKVYNSANKLFMLSKYMPVGIMIYGNASMMGVPWESIVKIYRNELKDKKCDNLRQYADEFIGHIDGGCRYISSDEVESYLYSVLRSFYKGFMLEEMKDRLEKIYKSNKRIRVSDIKSVVASVISEQYEEWKRIDYLKHFPDGFADSLIVEYKDMIKAVIKESFEKMPISKEDRVKLETLASYIFTKDRFSPSQSGVVIAGYGEGEIYPSLCSFKVDFIVGGRLKYKFDDKKSYTITHHTAASIIPFAQDEVVRTFIEGVDPDLSRSVNSYISKLLSDYPGRILDTIKTLSPTRKKSMLDKFGVISRDLISEYEKAVTSYLREIHVDPILTAVSVLPKDELAAMAESLVNLTSFKRRVSMDMETVGGPIDVAVISKGDGFVWIKRKHYFKPELNNHYFANYYKSF